MEYQDRYPSGLLFRGPIFGPDIGIAFGLAYSFELSADLTLSPFHLSAFRGRGSLFRSEMPLQLDLDEIIVAIEIKRASCWDIQEQAAFDGDGPAVGQAA